VIAYLDASALVKYLIEEPGTDRAERLWQTASDRYTSRITYAEARAALARAGRDGRTTPREQATARRGLDMRWDALRQIGVTDGLVRLAGDLADRRALRGYDAVHLASALILGGEVVMATWDRELSDAASEEGLPTLTI